MFNSTPGLFNVLPLDQEKGNLALESRDRKVIIITIYFV